MEIVFLAAILYLYIRFSIELLYQWPSFHRQIHSEKYFSELGSIGTPLDH